MSSSVGENSSVASSDLFLTEIDSERRRTLVDHELLMNVRKDHLKIREVVNAFRSKVDKLIDKQRQEYIQAYESHMQDVQKELHFLREKVNDIANDDTKNERTEKLKTDLNNFKDEAIRLETDSDELRVAMARLVRKIYTVERTRDWMLKKLRQAKKRYNQLVKEKARLYEEMSQASISNASTYTLEIQALNSGQELGITDKFQRAIQANAHVERQVHLPSISKGPKLSSSMSHQNITLNKSRSSNPWRVSASQIERKHDQLSDLLAVRSMRQELKNFVNDCANSLHRRPWSRVDKRPTSELLIVSQECIMSNDSETMHKSLLPLACELAATPAVYQIVLELLQNEDRMDGRSSGKNDNDYVDISGADNPILNWSV